MEEMFDRNKALRNKYKYCAYDPNINVYSNFSNYPYKVLEYIQSCNARLTNLGLRKLKFCKGGVPCDEV